MTDVRIEGIRRTNAGTWAVVGSRRGESVVPERSPRVLTLVSDHAGPGAKAAAIRAAGTNRVLTDSELSIGNTVDVSHLAHAAGVTA